MFYLNSEGCLLKSFRADVCSENVKLTEVRTCPGVKQKVGVSVRLTSKHTNYRFQREHKLSTLPRLAGRAGRVQHTSRIQVRECKKRIR